MNWYEGMFIINPLLKVEETDKVVADLEGEIKKLKGEVKEARRFGKKTLAYPINKQKEGSYLLLYFRLDPAQLDAFTKKLHLNEQVLRHLILQSYENAMKEANFRMEEPHTREYEEAY